MADHILINSLGGGGSERQVVAISRGVRGGVPVITLEEDKKYDLDAPHTSIALPFLRGALAHTLAVPLYAIRLAQRIRREDTALSFLERSNFVNVAARLFRRHRTILSERQSPSAAYPPMGLGNQVQRFLIKLLYPRADHIVANSEGTKHDLVHDFGVPQEKVSVIYNVCDADVIRRVAAEGSIDPRLAGSDFIVANIRMTYQKAPWAVLRSFAVIKKQFPALKLALLGDGPLMPRMQEMARELGIQGAVLFLGFQKNPFPYMRPAKALVLASLWEGFPNVVLEALACGTPVVAADCRYGPREILAPDTAVTDVASVVMYAKYGVLTPPIEPGVRDTRVPLTPGEEKLAAALVGLLKDTARADSYRALAAERVKDFASEAIMPQWERLLASNNRA
jgi:glycosyltransferase involved in cell wall biosynthesis